MYFTEIQKRMHIYRVIFRITTTHLKIRVAQPTVFYEWY